MVIDEKTAQLILDAIAWSNKDWEDNIGWDEEHSVETDRLDFVRFCEARGIKGIERVTVVKGE